MWWALRFCFFLQTQLDSDIPRYVYLCSHKALSRRMKPMLVLSRKLGEKIRIGDAITVQVLALAGNRVRLGIEAPPDVEIFREEICNPDVVVSSREARSSESTTSPPLHFTITT